MIIDERHNHTSRGIRALEEALALSLTWMKVGMVILVGYVIFSGVFILEQDENAVILRFGKIVGTMADRVKKPGIHWAFPYPIDEVVRIPVSRVEMIASDSFWYATNDIEQITDKENIPPALVPGVDGYSLTGDLNILHLQYVLRYTVSAPVRHLFDFDKARVFLEALVTSSVIETAAAFRIDDALRRNVEGFRTGVLSQLEGRLARTDLGVAIQGLDIVSLAPPRQTKRAFDSVLEAEQERSRTINIAKAYKLRSQQESQAQAAQIRSQAQVYRAQVFSRAKADADYFSQVYEQYRASPTTIARIIYEERLSRILQQCEKKYLLKRRDKDKKMQLRIQLGPEPVVPTQG